MILLVGAGVRRAELAGLQLEQVDLETGRVEVRQGKGRKDRVCWLPPSALPAVRDWLAVRGPAPGPLLLPVRKGGRIEDRALSAQAVRDLGRELARLAAIEAFTPHDLRRTWTGDLLEASGDLAIVQQLAGHASPATTSRYDRRPEGHATPGRRAAPRALCRSPPGAGGAQSGASDAAASYRFAFRQSYA